MALPHTAARKRQTDLPVFLNNREAAGPLRALLWKDLRLIRMPLLLGGAVLLMPYAVCAAAIPVLDSLSSAFRSTGLISIALGGLVFPFWSGHLASTEHVSRTARFLSSLPAPRHKVALSKLLLTLSPVTAISAANLMLLLTVDRAVPGSLGFGPNLTWKNLGTDYGLIDNSRLCC